MIQLKLNEIKRETICPVDLQKVGYNNAHSKFPLAEMMETANGVLTVLPKQCIKTVVKGLMQSITFAVIHDRPKFIAFGPL
jgi:hypothetical protein